MSFAHLHVHTEFSLLDGSNKIKEYVSSQRTWDEQCGNYRSRCYVWCDRFLSGSQEAGDQSILGCEVYVAPNSRFDREITGGDDRYYHLVLRQKMRKDMRI